MEPTISKVCLQLDSIATFLKPLLPLANCHMVEFFTNNHWEKLIPDDIKIALDDCDLNATVDKFWTSAKTYMPNENCILSNWIYKTRQNCISIDNEYCIVRDKLQQEIVKWGGTVKNEIVVKEFMNSKKSYEVQTMSSLVASLHKACGATCCVEVGGGRGHLPVALSLGYSVPSLTIDCDEKTVNIATERVKTIQKQWHAIAKNVDNGNENSMSKCVPKDLHRFASVFVTKHTDLCAIVKDKFPEYTDVDMKLLLTGLHTCGNLGPDSLRIFAKNPSVAAVFNVPCCYHLLTEQVDVSLFDIFQKDADNSSLHSEQGFPMSEYLRGYNLGRNARMLAAQSFDRVVHQKQLPSKTLLYRALLQVLIKQHLPNLNVLEGKLKRLNKCQNFEQYLKNADAFLDLDLYEKLPRGYLTKIYNEIDVSWKKIVLFYLLRLCLAQVVESVILLDRLLYLYENGFNKVYLVKLFDPVLSPRCHSIVAIR
ncbi:hypothetical protein ACJJTC_006289 [Scirpophaga incertulas]